jgi:putative membrane protein
MGQQRATDTLANERTFLAYLRTALAFIAFGFVIARFSLFSRELALAAHVRVASSPVATAFGIAMALIGIAVGAYGSYRYIAAGRAIRAGTESSMPDAAAIVSGALIGAIGFVVAATLFATR